MRLFPAFVTHCRALGCSGSSITGCRVTSVIHVLCGKGGFPCSPLYEPKASGSTAGGEPKASAWTASPSRITLAMANSLVWVIESWVRITPMPAANSAARPCNCKVGLPLGSRTTSISSQPTPLLMPVPSPWLPLPWQQNALQGFRRNYVFAGNKPVRPLYRCDGETVRRNVRPSAECVQSPPDQCPCQQSSQPPQVPDFISFAARNHSSNYPCRSDSCFHPLVCLEASQQAYHLETTIMTHRQQPIKSL